MVPVEVHTGARRARNLLAVLIRGNLQELHIQPQPGTCFFKHYVYSSILKGQRFSHFEILTPKALPWTGITHLFLLVLPVMSVLWVVTAHGLGIMDDPQGVPCTRRIKTGLEVTKDLQL